MKRITNTSATIIDYVVAKDKTSLKCEVLNTPKISDHSILVVSFGLMQTKVINKVVLKRDWSKFNIDLFHNSLIETTWDNFSTNVNVLAGNFVGIIDNLINNMCPLREVNFTIRSNKIAAPWMTGEIIALMQARDDIYSKFVLTRDAEDWILYKIYRNRVVSFIRFEKEKYFYTELDAHLNNPKTLWKNLKALLPNNKYITPDTVKFGNVTYTEPRNIANHFNNYFVNSIGLIVNQIQRVNPIEQVTDLVRNCGVFQAFTPLAISDLKELMSELKSTGGVFNSISTFVLKEASKVTLYWFLDVINLSLESGKFPEDWKLSCVTPAPKVPNADTEDKFRPLNMVPVYEKVLEMAVNKQLQRFLDENEVITDAQSGFRSNHSCETLFIKTIEEWMAALDQDHFIVPVFLDFKRAFETINRDILIRKLQKIGITGHALKWFREYLSNRFQAVRYGGIVSEKIETEHGVPQGTVLGPVLFNLYINDIVQCVLASVIDLFADDTKIYAAGSDLGELSNRLNADLARVSEWLKDNQMALNLSKSKFMVIGKSNSLNKAAADIENLNIVIDGEKLERVNSIKYLGVIVDNKLEFKEHAQYICNKMSFKLHTLQQIARDMSLNVKFRLYKALIAPQLSYCGTIFCHLNLNEIKKFQCIQNRAMRFILKVGRRTEINQMLNALNILSVSQQLVYHRLNIVYKLYKSVGPAYLIRLLPRNREIHDHNTRSCNDFVTARAASAKSNKSFCHSGIEIFNSLPTEIKASTPSRRMYHF